jgi:mannose-6-phosphate isomerase-like protein (cupin superfamily)
MECRRVVTGRQPDGTSVFVSDEIVDAKRVGVMRGIGFAQMWGSDDLVQLPSDGTQPEWSTFFPPMTGFRFLCWSLPPDDTPIPEGTDIAAAAAELQRELPGLIEAGEPDHPGMHTTDTIDFDVVLSGEVWLELDNGEEVRLKAGDCVVQNGTRHAWHNKTSVPAVMVTALVGARA